MGWPQNDPNAHQQLWRDHVCHRVEWQRRIGVPLQARPPENLVGDLNLDDVVDNQDISLCVDVILGRESNVGIINRADLDGDGRILVLDLQWIVNSTTKQ